MTDKELIQAYREHCETNPLCVGCPVTAPYEDCEVQAKTNVEYLMSRLEALIAENEHLREVTKMVQRWHPASEPPKEYRDEYGELKCFLVCMENCTQPFRAFYDGKHWGDGWNVLAVTHWMDLPKPPSTEGVE